MPTGVYDHAAVRQSGNGNWSGGRHIASNGYVKVSLGEGHPLADSKGYIYEHLLVWITSGRPRPLKGFLIHHKDLNKTHNDIDNLELKGCAAHAYDHLCKTVSEVSLDALANRYLAGESYIALAKELGVHRNWLSDKLRSSGRVPRVTHERLVMISHIGAAARWPNRKS
jgi:hypothetical protein